MALSIVLNGEQKRLHEPQPRTLDDLIAVLALNPGQVAIEHNGAIVRRSDWKAKAVQDGDRLEIVQFVGGG